jgi:hypothetical protein
MTEEGNYARLEMLGYPSDVYVCKTCGDVTADPGKHEDSRHAVKQNYTPPVEQRRQHHEEFVRGKKTTEHVITVTEITDESRARGGFRVQCSCNGLDIGVLQDELSQIIPIHFRVHKGD